MFRASLSFFWLPLIGLTVFRLNAALADIQLPTEGLAPARVPASTSLLYVPDMKEARPTLRNDASKPDVEPAGEEPSSRLTGDWGGLRKSLLDRGVDFALTYKLEYNNTLAGGAHTGETVLGNIDIKASIDMQKLTGTKGLSFFFYGLGNHGGDPSKSVGDTQVTSNIETSANAFKIYEAWAQQVGFEDRVSILVGLHDLNSEFYVTESSSLFFNSSFGVGRDLSQTGANGPSIFPVTSAAIRVRVEPTKDFYVQSGLFSGAAGDPSQPQGTHVRISSDDGSLTISEAAFLRGRKEGSGLNQGKYAIGMWSYSRPVTKIDEPDKTTTNTGYYFLIDQAVSASTSVFARAGFANSEVNTVSNNFSTGVVTKGLFTGRESDRTGLGVTQVRAGEAYRTAQAAQDNSIEQSETAFEVNHRFELPHGFALQPDLQYILNPSFSSTVPSATVFATRVEINF